MKVYDMKAHENIPYTTHLSPFHMVLYLRADYNIQNYKHYFNYSYKQLKFEHYVYLLNYAILKWTFQVFRTTDCNTAAEKNSITTG